MQPKQLGRRNYAKMNARSPRQTRRSPSAVDYWIFTDKRGTKYHTFVTGVASSPHNTRTCKCFEKCNNEMWHRQCHAALIGNPRKPNVQVSLKYRLSTYRYPPFSFFFYLWQKMTADSTCLDVESTDHDQHSRSELDNLLGNELKVLTNQEDRSARAQFLALCWALFVIGWFDGSTGPLLPRIKKFYDVSWLYSFWLFFLNVLI